MDEIKAETKIEEKPSLVNDAEKAAERLEKSNAELKELLDRKEQMLAKERLGGRSSLSIPPLPPIPKSYKEECLEALKDFQDRKLKPFA